MTCTGIIYVYTCKSCKCIPLYQALKRVSDLGLSGLQQNTEDHKSNTEVVARGIGVYG